MEQHSHFSRIVGQVQLLSQLHWIYGPINMFYALILGIYFGIIAFVALIGVSAGHGKGAEIAFGIMLVFVALFGLFTLWLLLTGIGQLFSGWWLKSGKHLWLVRLTAIAELFCIPYGTISGIYTLKVLESAEYKNEIATTGAFNTVAAFPEVAGQAKLDMLCWLHRLTGIFSLLFAFLPLIYVALGGFALLYPAKMLKGNETIEDIMMMGWLFIILGLLFSLVIVVYGVLKLVAASAIKKAKNRILCYIVAGLECMIVPHGTALGVLTILAMNESPIKAMFDPQNPPAIELA